MRKGQQQKQNILLSLHNQEKDSEFKPYLLSLSLGNISKDFTINNMTEIGLKGSATVFSVDYRAINTDKILDIYRILIKEIL